MQLIHKVKRSAFRAVGVAFLLCSSVSPVIAQGYAGTGLAKESLENFCQMGALQGVMGKTSTRHYVDTTLKGRFAMGNSTAQQYKNQINWFRSNCPAY